MKQNLARIIAVFVLIIASGCNLNNPTVIPGNPQKNDQVLVMVTFRVKLPAPLPPGDALFLAELDEVTSLSFNQKRHPMEADDSQTFHVNLPFPLGSVIKYKYLRQGQYIQQEYSLDGSPVRYRMVLAKEPILIQDIISRWVDSNSPYQKGRLTGKVIESGTGNPIPNLLVSAGGSLTWTSSEGIFQIQDIPEGTHNLIVYPVDGFHSIFQQEALISADSETQANVTLDNVQPIKVSLTVRIPEDTPKNATVKIAGNLVQLGNSFADLRGGMNHTAVRLPALSQAANGRYQITLSLPAGSDIRYKYTLGDGIWNAEHDAVGEFYTRQIILPDHDISFDDMVTTWRDSSALPIYFNVETPITTPEDETVSIQFNPGYTWLEPIPLWNAGSNRWQYKLYSPLSGLDSIKYRYCRDVQCGSADDASTSGPLNTGRTKVFATANENQIDRVENWAWYDGKPASAVVPNLDISSRGDAFIAGIELQLGFHPSWFVRFPATLKSLVELNANWVVTHPSWTFQNSTSPIQEVDPGHDILPSELSGILNLSRSESLKTAIFPISNFPKSSDIWWADATRDFPWWVSWYDRYQEFLLHHAIIAEQTGSEALIIGDPSIKPALPGGTLSNGDSSNVPEDALERWQKILTSIREIYHGQIWWVIEDPNDIADLTGIQNLVDAYYVLWDEPLSSETGTSLDIIEMEAGKTLDEKILPLQEISTKPVILSISYPSALGGITGCIPGLESECLDITQLNQPNPDIPNISIDLQDQENAYNAIFLAVKDRPWIAGVVSRGFYPPVPLQDKSISIHGKPASGVTWFWFGKLTGK